MPIEGSMLLAQAGAAPGPMALVLIVLMPVAIAIALANIVMTALLLGRLVKPAIVFCLGTISLATFSTFIIGVVLPSGEIWSSPLLAILSAPIAAGLLSMAVTIGPLRSPATLAIGVMGLIAAVWTALTWREMVLLTELREAVNTQNVPVARALLRSGTGRQWREGLFRQHMLRVAARVLNDALVEELLAAGANPNDCEQGSPLMLAITSDGFKKEWRARIFEVVKRLLDHGADPNATCDNPTEYNRTPAEAAWSNGEVDVLALLEARGAKDVTKIQRTYDALIRAAADGDVARVKAAIDTHIGRHIKDVHSRSPLIAAAANGHLDVIDVLLERPTYMSDCELVDDGFAAAAQANHREIFARLLDAGFCLKHDAAVRAAVQYGRLDLLRAALARGFAVNPTQPEGSRGTALDIAIRGGNKEIVRELLRHGALQAGTPQ